MTFWLCTWQPPLAVKDLIFCDAAPTVGPDVAVYILSMYTVSVLLLPVGSAIAAFPLRQRLFMTKTGTRTGVFPLICVQPVVVATKKPNLYASEAAVVALP